jgi:hypothetical protein
MKHYLINRVKFSIAILFHESTIGVKMETLQFKFLYSGMDC